MLDTNLVALDLPDTSKACEGVESFIPTLLLELSTYKVFVSTVKSPGKVTLSLASLITAFEAGKVQNTILVPAEKSTGLSLFDDEITCVLAN